MRKRRTPLIKDEKPAEREHFTHPPSQVRNQQVRGSNPRASFDFSGIYASTARSCYGAGQQMVNTRADDRRGAWGCFRVFIVSPAPRGLHEE
jgi:hypothetical protein